MERNSHKEFSFSEWWLIICCLSHSTLDNIVFLAIASSEIDKQFHRSSLWSFQSVVRYIQIIEIKMNMIRTHGAWHHRLWWRSYWRIHRKWLRIFTARSSRPTQALIYFFRIFHRSTPFIIFPLFLYS